MYMYMTLYVNRARVLYLLTKNVKKRHYQSFLQNNLWQTKLNESMCSKINMFKNKTQFNTNATHSYVNKNGIELCLQNKEVQPL